jgi:hypothetical protein
VALLKSEIGVVKLTTRNVSGIVANIHAFNDEVQLFVRGNVEFWGHATVDETRARMLAHDRPVFDTGRMYENVEVRFGPSHLTYEAGWWPDAFDADGVEFYPILVELGTLTMPARPSLFPANELIRPLMLRSLSGGLRGITRRHSAS